MFDKIEKEIEELDGVISCKVTGKDEIDEIHIVASKSRKPKRIVRDIETITLVNVDEKIDHKKISIAQINNGSPDQAKNRVELISIYKENNSPTCHFKLKINDNLIEEDIQGETEAELKFIAAEGILRILERYINFKGKLRIENIFTTGLNDELIIVQIILHQGGKFGNQQRLVGASYVDHNLPLATGKACLKALNRQFSNLI
ncbi:MULTISPECIES: hypothetical protein [unclassified Candidatus Frackibacter]|uniref:hypothetical protein n=1 Tax=unclassified Candidatus Frackibacter TaxID=2648818 RepID=UPI00088C5E70|nr:MULTISPECIES: hypothetical protein [unclassified Candidatus Frackibacter]SDB96245.1 hypothetical protein SAMN04515661_1018 [Candidatus Frackibacter sp. WG11]SEM27675.1 hypothetical protein SAMN04488698_1019 [Candidatus Frackibacter sp. WG12]SFL32448.1 hypothetical protein SAMN04488699_1019 [Candidatus Frackibacter sp. WG13]